MVVHTSSAVVEHLEVVEMGRRRRWTEDEKLRIITESMSGPRRVAATALSRVLDANSDARRPVIPTQAGH